jgi:hypothetical protein
MPTNNLMQHDLFFAPGGGTLVWFFIPPKTGKKLVGKPRCGVRSAQRADPTFPESPSLTENSEEPISIKRRAGAAGLSRPRIVGLPYSPILNDEASSPGLLLFDYEQVT